MNVKISLEIDKNAKKKAKIILDLSKEMNLFFFKRDYGSDVEEILIGVICIKTKLGYEEWYKPRKPKYIDYKNIKNKLTGLEIKIRKSFSFDFRIDNEAYDNFVSSGDNESKKRLKSLLINSLSNLDNLPEKVKKFDKKKFKNDMLLFLDENGISTG